MPSAIFTVRQMLHFAKYSLCNLQKARASCSLCTFCITQSTNIAFCKTHRIFCIMQKQHFAEFKNDLSQMTSFATCKMRFMCSAKDSLPDRRLDDQLIGEVICKWQKSSYTLYQYCHTSSILPSLSFARDNCILQMTNIFCIRQSWVITGPRR